GISQRRVRNGVAVQIYLDIEGSSHKRASLVRDFYLISKKGEPTKYRYPDIHPEVMGTISQLTGHLFTVNEVVNAIKNVLLNNLHLITDSLSNEESNIFHKRLQQMEKRNVRLPY